MLSLHNLPQGISSEEDNGTPCRGERGGGVNGEGGREDVWVVVVCFQETHPVIASTFSL